MGRIGILALAGLALCRAAAASDEPLRALADRDNFRIGAAVAISPFWADRTYRATLDRYSWIPGYFAGYGEALSSDANDRPKPAYRALHAALEASAE
jgi:hypothetical protein